jgi:hypothetical protein
VNPDVVLMKDQPIQGDPGAPQIYGTFEAESQPQDKMTLNKTLPSAIVASGQQDGAEKVASDEDTLRGQRIARAMHEEFAKIAHEEAVEEAYSALLEAGLIHQSYQSEGLGKTASEYFEPCLEKIASGELDQVTGDDLITAYYELQKIAADEMDYEAGVQAALEDIEAEAEKIAAEEEYAAGAESAVEQALIDAYQAGVNDGTGGGEDPLEALKANPNFIKALKEVGLA